MSGYEYLDRSSTRCVHFVRACTTREFLKSDVNAAKAKGFKLAYWSYLDGGRQCTSVANPLAAAIGLEHVPYGKRAWVQFLDGLITLAYRHDGLAIVIDRADLLITERREDMFECVEAFMHQFHHWYDQKKPCHLFLQILEDDCVTELFGRDQGAA